MGSFKAKQHQQGGDEKHQINLRKYGKNIRTNKVTFGTLTYSEVRHIDVRIVDLSSGQVYFPDKTTKLRIDLISVLIYYKTVEVSRVNSCPH